MKNKLSKTFLIIFLLCLIKIFHIGYFSSFFSTKILFHTFSPLNAENSSLIYFSSDLIPIKKYLIKEKINNYKIEDKILKKCSALCQRIIEFNHPISHTNVSKFMISLKEDKFSRCKEIIKTKNLKLNECN